MLHSHRLELFGFFCSKIRSFFYRCVDILFVCVVLVTVVAVVVAVVLVCFNDDDVQQRPTGLSATDSK